MLILLAIFLILAFFLIYRFGFSVGALTLIAIIILSSLFYFKRYNPDIWAKLNKPMYSAHKVGEKELALKIAKGLFFISDFTFSKTDIRRVEAIHHIGWLNWDLKKDKEAEKYLNMSLELYKEILLENKERSDKVIPPGVHGLGNEYYLLAVIYKNRGNLDKAIEATEKAKKYFEKEEPKYIWYRKDITNYLAKLYYEKGRRTESRSLYLEAKRL